MMLRYKRGMGYRGSGREEQDRAGQDRIFPWPVSCEKDGRIQPEKPVHCLPADLDVTYSITGHTFPHRPSPDDDAVLVL